MSFEDDQNNPMNVLLRIVAIDLQGGRLGFA
jgi:hypothetical protein